MIWTNARSSLWYDTRTDMESRGYTRAQIDERLAVFEAECEKQDEADRQEERRVRGYP